MSDSRSERYLADPWSYWKAPLRIVWLLKEVNDEGASESGLMKWIRAWVKHGSVGKHGKFTAGPIAKVSFGLLNPERPWTEWCQSSRTYVPALASIAWVNLKALPGGTSSVPAKIRRAFELDRESLAGDLVELKPDIVIGGNTFQFCAEWLNGWTPYPPNLESYDSTVIDGRVWVNAHHPGNRGKGWSHVGYFERIKDAVKRA